METAPRNCRFLSLVVVKHVLTRTLSEINFARLQLQLREINALKAAHAYWKNLRKHWRVQLHKEITFARDCPGLIPGFTWDFLWVWIFLGFSLSLFPFFPQQKGPTNSFSDPTSSWGQSRKVVYVNSYCCPPGSGCPKLLMGS